MNAWCNETTLKSMVLVDSPVALTWYFFIDCLGVHQKQCILGTINMMIICTMDSIAETVCQQVIL